MSPSHFQFAGLRLTHKVTAIGATGVLGLALVGGLYLFGAWSQARYEKTAAEASAIAASTGRLSIQMLEARRAEKDFLLRSDEKYAKAHGDLIKDIAGTFDDIARRLSASGRPELLKQTDAARADYEQYVKHFAALCRFAAQDRPERERRASGGAAEGRPRDRKHGHRSSMTSKLEAGMLTMRRHEKDFMLRRDAKYGDEMKKAAADFARALAGSPLSSAQKDDIAQKLALYQRDFFAYMAGVQAAGQEQKALSDAYARFEPQIAAVIKAIDVIRDEAMAAREAATAATDDADRNQHSGGHDRRHADRLRHRPRDRPAAQRDDRRP